MSGGEEDGCVEHEDRRYYVTYTSPCAASLQVDRPHGELELISLSRNTFHFTKSSQVEDVGFDIQRRDGGRL